MPSATPFPRLVILGDAKQLAETHSNKSSSKRKLWLLFLFAWVLSGLDHECCVTMSYNYTKPRVFLFAEEGTRKISVRSITGPKKRNFFFYIVPPLIKRKRRKTRGCFLSPFVVSVRTLQDLSCVEGMPAFFHTT